MEQSCDKSENRAITDGYSQLSKQGLLKQLISTERERREIHALSRAQIRQLEQKLNESVQTNLQLIDKSLFLEDKQDSIKEQRRSLKEQNRSLLKEIEALKNSLSQIQKENDDQFRIEYTSLLSQIETLKEENESLQIHSQYLAQENESLIAKQRSSPSLAELKSQFAQVLFSKASIDPNMKSFFTSLMNEHSKRQLESIEAIKQELMDENSELRHELSKQATLSSYVSDLISKINNVVTTNPHDKSLATQLSELLSSQKELFVAIKSSENMINLNMRLSRVESRPKLVGSRPTYQGPPLMPEQPELYDKSLLGFLQCSAVVIENYLKQEDERLLKEEIYCLTVKGFE